MTSFRFAVKILCPCIILPVLLISCAAYDQSSPPAEGSWWPEKVLSPAERQQEASVKLDRIVGFLRREQLSGLLITTAHNFSWITAGGDGRLFGAKETGAIPLFVRQDGRRFVVGSAGNANRLMKEDLKDMGYEWKEIPWYTVKAEANRMTAVLKELSGDQTFGVDAPYAGARLVDEAVAALRAPLMETEVRKYRWLGRKCAEAVDAVCRRIRPSMTERGIEALISDALLRHAIQPEVIRVAADERLTDYRHATPSDMKAVEKHVMLGICAGRWGLVIAMTRQVHFGPLPAMLHRSLEAAARINAGFWARTLPGATAGSILQGAIADYAEIGLPLEWHMQDQGGAIGYQAWDWIAVPGSGAVVRTGQAFAWCPAVGGVCVQDTILLVGDGMEVLTEIPGWPVVESRALGRIYRSPGILVR